MVEIFFKSDESSLKCDVVKEFVNPIPMHAWNMGFCEVLEMGSIFGVGWRNFEKGEKGELARERKSTRIYLKRVEHTMEVV